MKETLQVLLSILTATICICALFLTFWWMYNFPLETPYAKCVDANDDPYNEPTDLAKCLGLRDTFVAPENK